jgi:hypothetical protein
MRSSARSRLLTLALAASAGALLSACSDSSPTTPAAAPAFAKAVSTPVFTPGPVSVPQPAPGSFTTVVDFLQDGRVVVFDGFTVYVQESIGSSTLVPIGTLPAEFQGATDPAFIEVSPNGRTIVLGAGAGGSQFPNPEFNGNIFLLPVEGGEATLLGRFPFSIEATFRGPNELVFSQGETFGLLTGSVELVDINTGEQVTLVGPVPGDATGVAFDKQGNLYVGLGFAQDPSRTGEIRRFDKQDVQEAIRTGVPLPYDSGTLVTQVLSGGPFEFDSAGNLWVGGGDLFGSTGSFGFFAQVDVETGEILNRFDPQDGDPNDQDFVFYNVAFTRKGCRVAAFDSFSLFSGPATLYEAQVCGGGTD